MPSNIENESTTVIRFRNSLACVQCRSRHVKCDANKPGCTRCKIDGKNCYFMKSRRGMRSKTSNSSTEVPLASADEQVKLNTSPTTTIPSLEASETQFQTSLVQYTAYHNASIPKVRSLESELERNLGLYYTFFHNAHPWVLPRPRLEQLIQTHREQVQGLLTVIDFIGSTFGSEGQSGRLREIAISTMTAQDVPKSAFTVQALLILAVGVHCCTDFQLARETLDRGIDIALEIGMHQQSFAITNGNGDPVLEESWRRTWWGMFVVEGTIEAIRRTYKFKLWHLHSDVELPCEERHYKAENIPPSRTLAEYNERDVAEYEISYSSFTYLIDIVNILGALMAAAVACDEITDAIINDADGRLMNWKLHLPLEKNDIIGENGEVDEPLFQAHMNFNVIQVHAHRLRSRLLHSPIEDTAKCAPPPPPFDVPTPMRQSFWLSTKKTLDAAENAINLFTLPTPLANHTPMVVCGVVLSILAQLSACSFVLQDAQYENARDRIRLGIGALKEYGKIWQVGQQSLVEVKSIAREIFATAASRKLLDDEPGFIMDDLQQNDSLDIQSYYDEFGSLDYLSMLDIPALS